MQILMRESKLTDGSPVYDVVLSDHDGAKITIPAASLEDGEKLAKAIHAATREHSNLACYLRWEA